MRNVKHQSETSITTIVKSFIKTIAYGISDQQSSKQSSSSSKRQSSTGANAPFMLAMLRVMLLVIPVLRVVLLVVMVLMTIMTVTAYYTSQQSAPVMLGGAVKLGGAVTLGRAVCRTMVASVTPVMSLMRGIRLIAMPTIGDVMSRSTLEARGMSSVAWPSAMLWRVSTPMLLRISAIGPVRAGMKTGSTVMHIMVRGLGTRSGTRSGARSGARPRTRPHMLQMSSMRRCVHWGGRRCIVSCGMGPGTAGR